MIRMHYATHEPPNRNSYTVGASQDGSAETHVVILKSCIYRNQDFFVWGSSIESYAHDKHDYMETSTGTSSIYQMLLK